MLLWKFNIGFVIIYALVCSYVNYKVVFRLLLVYQTPFSCPKVKLIVGFKPTNRIERFSSMTVFRSTRQLKARLGK